MEYVGVYLYIERKAADVNWMIKELDGKQWGNLWGGIHPAVA